MKILDAYKGEGLKAFFNSDELVSLSFNKKVERIEEEMKKLPQLDIPVQHFFLNGVYARQILIPKGTLLVSKYHKFEQIDIMLTGVLAVATSNGISVLKAPYMGVSKVGKKRIGFTYEDVLWIDIHRTDETDIEKIEKTFYADTEEDMQRFFIESQVEDFNIFLKEYGISEELIKEQTENEVDRVDFNLDKYGLSVKDSMLAGKGLFSLKDFIEGDLILPARINGFRTQAGRYTNHSNSPNGKFEFNGDDINLVALRNISNEEITVNYRDALALQGIFARSKECQE